jgi:hypothetical protein
LETQKQKLITAVPAPVAPYSISISVAAENYQQLKLKNYKKLNSFRSLHFYSICEQNVRSPTTYFYTLKLLAQYCKYIFPCNAFSLYISFHFKNIYFLTAGLKLTPSSVNTTSSSSPSALSVSRIGGPGGGPGGGAGPPAAAADRIAAGAAANTVVAATPVNIKQEPQQQQAATTAVHQQQQQHPNSCGSMESAAYVDSTTFPPLEPQEAEYSLEEIGNGTFDQLSFMYSYHKITNL